jgi:soluble lytic murein transglycosylase-like protein
MTTVQTKKSRPPDKVRRALETASMKTAVPYSILEAVAWAESRFNSEAKSNKGALGLMQLMPANIKHYGVTDPLDPYQSALAGATMLEQLYKTYHDWNLVFAAYNWGSGNVTSNPKPEQWPAETQHYIIAINGRLGRPIPFSAKPREV